MGVLLGTGAATRAYAQDGRNVLLVANEAVSDSVEVARRYAATRGVPEAQLLRVSVAGGDEISRGAFERDIQTPIASWLAQHAAQDRILYIVLTHGMPLRIAGTRGRAGTVASVDSELALLYRRMAGADSRLQGPIANPYFLGGRSIDELGPFDRSAHDIYLVTRLDGFTAADALALVERGATPGREGRILLDQPANATDIRAKWFTAAVDRLATGTFRGRVVYDTSARALKDESDVFAYYSWGSNDPALAVRHPGLRFQPGAIAATFVSTDARTVVEPPAEWQPSRPGRRNDYRGSSQSLAADLVRAGVTGVSGQVAEPYVDGAIRPDIVLPAYLAGLTLAEAFYSAMPYLSWQTVVFGDPLCAPFQVPARVMPAGLDTVDPDTELPVIFSNRRLANLHAPGTSDVVRKLMLRAEARAGRSDREGAVEALERATRLDAKLAPAWRALAHALEQLGRYPEANDAHRQVLALDPDDIPSLNNLAYNMAVHLGAPGEALPLARRAARLAERDPQVDDTLAWIHHLLGNNEEAARLLEPARRAAGTSATIHLHAAIVFHALGRVADADQALQAAAELDPSVRENSEYRQLASKLR